MLRLVRELGFAVGNTDDPSVASVTLALQDHSGRAGPTRRNSVAIHMAGGTRPATDRNAWRVGPALRSYEPSSRARAASRSSSDFASALML